MRNLFSLQAFTVYMENSLLFELDFGQIDCSEICTEVWSHVNYNKKVSLHQSEILPQNEISNWFEFTLGLM